MSQLKAEPYIKERERAHLELDELETQEPTMAMLSKRTALCNKIGRLSRKIENLISGKPELGDRLAGQVIKRVNGSSRFK